MYTKTSSSMPLHVQRQVVRSAEGPLTQITAERFLSRVLPVMPRQFVRAREFPRTTIPGTLIRFFTCTKKKQTIPQTHTKNNKTCVRPLVRFQVRTLRVHLVAARHIATVHLPPPQYGHLGRFRILTIVIVVVVVIAV